MSGNAQTSSALQLRAMDVFNTLDVDSDSAVTPEEFAGGIRRLGLQKLKGVDAEDIRLQGGGTKAAYTMVRRINQKKLAT